LPRSRSDRNEHRNDSWHPPYECCHCEIIADSEQLKTKAQVSAGTFCILKVAQLSDSIRQMTSVRTGLKTKPQRNADSRTDIAAESCGAIETATMGYGGTTFAHRRTTKLSSTE
jgi:hypothetical protein